MITRLNFAVADEIDLGGMIGQVGIHARTRNAVDCFCKRRLCHGSHFKSRQIVSSESIDNPHGRRICRPTASLLVFSSSGSVERITFSTQQVRVRTLMPRDLGSYGGSRDDVLRHVAFDIG
jgi:hypothetical protein